MHGDTISFLSNRIEDTVGDAPQVSFHVRKNLLLT